MKSHAASFDPKLSEGSVKTPIFFTSTFRFDAGFVAALPDHVKVAASASSFLDHADLAAARARGITITSAATNIQAMSRKTSLKARRKTNELK